MQKKYITPPDNCTGCGLCASVCTRNAIRMVWSPEGFPVPEVNSEACINCGLCAKQCIALEPSAEYHDDITSVTSYGGWNKDSDIHLQSSSGGIFSALAVQTITQNGVVFGVKWQDKLTAVFDKVDTIEGLAQLRGSKYTPALSGNVYTEVLQELKSGRKVLFSGTPCQVHALRKYLRKPYENLLTIDIVCHGSPSHLLLEKYIQEHEEQSGKTIDHVSFRDKPEGWQNFHVTRHYTDGTTASLPLTTDTYMRMFLCDRALNKVCYNCPYAHIPRQGDITLGDYWEVQKVHPDWPLHKGISAILVNSEQGEQALLQLGDKIELRKEPFVNIYSGQSVVYVRPESEIPNVRELVLKEIKTSALADIHKRFGNSRKIGPFILNTKSLLYKIVFFPLYLADKKKRKKRRASLKDAIKKASARE